MINAYTILSAYGTTDDIDYAIRCVADALSEAHGGADAIPDWEATQAAMEVLDLEDGQDQAAVCAFRQLLARELEG